MQQAAASKLKAKRKAETLARVKAERQQQVDADRLRNHMVSMSMMKRRRTVKKLLLERFALPDVLVNAVLKFVGHETS